MNSAESVPSGSRCTPMHLTAHLSPQKHPVSRHRIKILLGCRRTSFFRHLRVAILRTLSNLQTFDASKMHLVLSRRYSKGLDILSKYAHLTICPDGVARPIISACRAEDTDSNSVRGAIFFSYNS